MKQIFDEDSANQASREDREQRNWEREQKNHILSSALSSSIKQRRWDEIFPKPVYSKEIIQVW